MVICTSDGDFEQLLRPRLTLVGVDDAQPRDEAALLTDYPGMTSAAQHLDLRALMGDASDNIKGVHGLGPQKSRELLQAHGWSLDALLRHAEAEAAAAAAAGGGGGGGKPVRLEGALQYLVTAEARAGALLSKELLELQRVQGDGELEDTGRLALRDPDCDAALALLDQLELKQVARRLQQLWTTSGAPEE